MGSIRLSRLCGSPTEHSKSGLGAAPALASTSWSAGLAVVGLSSRHRTTSSEVFRARSARIGTGDTRVFVGHTAVALAAKSRAPEVPLGWLVAAAFGLDLLWPIFLLTGLERVSI